MGTIPTIKSPSRANRCKSHTINATTPPIIAAFFADVDTRGGGSGLTTYGSIDFGTRSALCINWRDVGYYQSHVNKLNSVQALLVDRGDIDAGDFDIILSYDKVTWETGDASGGGNGMNGTPAGAGCASSAWPTPI